MDFAPACIKVLHGLGSILSYLHFPAFYMLFKFFRDDINLTVTAQVLHNVLEHL